MNNIRLSDPLEFARRPQPTVAFFAALGQGWRDEQRPAGKGGFP